MSVLCGWASIDERGQISGGRAGDQNGREVRTGSWYYFGQEVVLRWIDRELARKFCKAIKYLCDSPLVGYDQSQRTTLYNALKAVNWDYTKLKTNVEVDCSELIACAVNCALKKAVIPSYVYTGNLNGVLMNSGYFKKLTGSKYLSSDSYLKYGDILNRQYNHVIAVLEDGINAGKKSDTSKVAEPTLKKGCTGSEVKKLQSNLNSLNITDNDKNALALDGAFGSCTRQAVRKFQKKYSLEVDGIYGTKSASKMKTLIK